MRRRPAKTARQHAPRRRVRPLQPRHVTRVEVPRPGRRTRRRRVRHRLEISRHPPARRHPHVTHTHHDHLGRREPRVVRHRQRQRELAPRREHPGRHRPRRRPPRPVGPHMGHHHTVRIPRPRTVQTHRHRPPAHVAHHRRRPRHRHRPVRADTHGHLLVEAHVVAVDAEGAEADGVAARLAVGAGGALAGAAGERAHRVRVGTVEEREVAAVEVGGGGT